MGAAAAGHDGSRGADASHVQFTTRWLSPRALHRQPSRDRRRQAVRSDRSRTWSMKTLVKTVLASVPGILRSLPQSGRAGFGALC